jgi:hypothetical protein
MDAILGDRIRRLEVEVELVRSPVRLGVVEPLWLWSRVLLLLLLLLDLWRG